MLGPWDPSGYGYIGRVQSFRAVGICRFRASGFEVSGFLGRKEFLQGVVRLQGFRLRVLYGVPSKGLNLKPETPNSKQ